MRLLYRHTRPEEKGLPFFFCGCIPPFRAAFWILLLCLLGVSVNSPATEDTFPWKRFRKTVTTDRFVLGVEKNGAILVSLPDWTPVLVEARAGWSPSGEEPRGLSRKFGSVSTRREAASTELGSGHTIVVSAGNAEWYITTYPTQPIVTFQVLLVNTSKKPLTVRELIPLSAGVLGDGRWQIGSDPSRVVVSGEKGTERRLLALADIVNPSAGESEYDRIAISDAVSGQNAFIGPLTAVKAKTRVALVPLTVPGAVSLHVRCTYDPPVVLAPNERLLSELVYFAQGNTRVQDLALRYGECVAAIKGRTRPLAVQPCGWIMPSPTSSNPGASPISSDYVNEMSVFKRTLFPYGWKLCGYERVIALDQEPSTALASLQPTIQSFCDAAHSAAIQPLLHIRLTDPAGDAAPTITAGPASAYAPSAWVNAVQRQFSSTPLSFVLLDYTRVSDETYAQVARSLRLQGTAPSATAPPEVIYADSAARFGDYADVADRFRLLQPWPSEGTDNTVAVQAVPNSLFMCYLSQWYFSGGYRNFVAPTLTFLPHDLKTNDAPPSLTASAQGDLFLLLTASALLGIALPFADPPSLLPPTLTGHLQQLTPLLSRPALPIDYMEHVLPQIWHLPLQSDSGRWDLLGLFNWGEDEKTVLHVSLGRMGLTAPYYTVYDFWNQQYVGLAQGSLDIEVAPRRARLFGLRAFTGEPMLIASNRHFTQGALEHTRIAYDRSAKILSGDLRVLANAAYTLTLLVPDNFIFSEAEVRYASSGETVSVETTAEKSAPSVQIRFTTPRAGRVQWSARFAS